MTAQQSRLRFADENANDISSKIGVKISTRLPAQRTHSARFVWYEDGSRLTLVVGEHEERYVDEALAVGLSERKGRALQLLLPAGWHEPTLHRWPWLREDLDLAVWSHYRGELTALARPSREEIHKLVESPEQPQLFLSDRTHWVEGLMRWAGEQPDLDASHRRDVRAWQCRGQRVLRIHRTAHGLRIVAGIDWASHSPNASPEALDIADFLTAEQEAEIKRSVEAGCRQRMSGVAQKPDEHWLQAVLRRHPRVLGLEQPVLREMAAWRPSGSLGTRQHLPRGRGFVDLAGLDATGTLLLVETKLGADHMLVLQGLDYLIWAEANRVRLSQRLDCRPDVPFEIAYAVGGKGGGTPSWSAHSESQLMALAPDVRWHVQEVTDWTEDGPVSRRLGLRQLPSAARAAQICGGGIE